MRLFRFGLFCSTKNSTLSTNKSFRLQSLSKERLLDTVCLNLDGLEKIIPLCASHNITMFRLGNAIVPFASHKAFDPSWWDELEPLFAQTFEKIQNFPVRLTIHPGQFIQLGSKNPNVVTSSLAELHYCTKVLDMLHAKDGVITLHVGGRGESSDETMQRFYEVFSHNLWLQKYLALENDEYNFNANQTLELCNRCEIPMIFDIFHHSINPSKIAWSDIKQSWKTKRPKVHISSQGDGQKGMHAPFIEKKDFQALIDFLEEDVYNVDIMVEAKAKEEAIFALLESF